MMKKYIILSCIALMSLVSTSCSDDDFLLDSGVERIEGRPVELDISLNHTPMTRAGDVIADSKQQFEIGDLIHIQAVFECVDPTTGSSSTETKYGVMEYKGRGEWLPFGSTTPLTWPGTANTATFTAYYIDGSNGPLTDNTSEPKLLSSYTYGTDPLTDTNKDLPYGHVVRFNMGHLFSHLTLIEMKPGIADRIFFTIPDGDPNYSTFNNAFTIEFNSSTNTITPKFSRVPSTEYEKNGAGLVYVEAETENYMINMGEVYARASFFLEPAVYHKFEALYPRSRTTTETYVSFNGDLAETTGDDGFLPNGLYEFNVKKSIGSVIYEEPEDGWDDANAPRYDVEPEPFLKAINAGSDYYVDDLNNPGQKVQILESTSDGCRLLANVDFKYAQYDIFTTDGNFQPDQTLTFDGNYHSIYHLACPLFFDNTGTIQNLGIMDSATDTPLTSTENKTIGGQSYDLSYTGLICRRNINTIRNVRVSNVDMTVNIETSDDVDVGGETHNVSLLIGSNVGTVYNLYLAGNLNLTVSNAPGETMMPTVSIGGLAGQNPGMITTVSAITDEGYVLPEISIVNQCDGITGSDVTGAYIIGGAAGYCGGGIYDVMFPKVTVNSGTSRGLESYIGGLVGRVTSSTGAGNAATLADCLVRGSVTAGHVESTTNKDSYSYIGGIAGLWNLQGVTTGCTSTVNVAGEPSASSGVTYGTGGAFGGIRQTAGATRGVIQILKALGNSLSGPGSYVGNFAGIAPDGVTWESLDPTGNEISVSQIVPNNIGGNLTSND